MNQTESRTGARILIDQLNIHGVDRVFCVPGESYLAALDALHDTTSISVVACRHESGAAMMADAYGKLTGRPGICMVTRGPGATNASAGLHVAMQDSTPMILFIGQVARHMTEREAFQELDYRRAFGQLAKWVAEIDDARRIPEFVSRAFHVATSGRPGPVVLSLPEDMLTELAQAQDVQPWRPVRTAPDAFAMAALRDALARAERPLVLLGGSGWDQAAVDRMHRFAERSGLPVATTFRRQDRFDNRHRCYAGDVGIGINPQLAARVQASDFLLVIGARLGEMTTSGYKLLGLPVPRQFLAHVHPDAEELGRVYQPSLAIHAGAGPIAAALEQLELPANPAWRAWTQAARADYLAYIEPTASPGPIQMAEVVSWLNRNLPDDAVIANGAGNFTTWVHRFFQCKRHGNQLAPTSGSMGYGLPAAIAAKLIAPSKTVVCVAGDGDFMMTSQELATAAQYGAHVIVVVVDNGMYGTIRMHQERHYPERVIATELVNPDFVMLARSYGAHAEAVATTADFPAAFERAQAAGRLALLLLKVDPEALTPRQSLSEIRAAGLAARH